MENAREAQGQVNYVDLRKSLRNLWSTELILIRISEIRGLTNEF